MAASEAERLVAGLHEEIERRADEIEAARRMAADGMFRLLVPRRYGGGEAHPQQFFDAVAATARADGAAGWCQMIGATTGLLAASLPEAWAETIYGADPNVVTSGVTAPLGRAEPVEGGYRVSGRWPFGSGCEISQWICGGTVVMEDGAPKPGEHDLPESLLMMFPAADVTIHDTWHTSGLCGSGSHDIEVSDVFVPEGRWAVLGGRPRVDAPLYRFPTLGLLALGVSAVAIGIAERAVDEVQVLAGGKVPTGGRRTLAERPATQRDLARAWAALRSARAYTADAIGQAWEEANGDGRLGRDRRADLRLAATHNTWSAVAAVDLMYHLGGGSAIYRNSPLQRCFRDVHVATQHIMVAQPTYEVVGKVLLGIDPRTLL